MSIAADTFTLVAYKHHGSTQPSRGLSSAINSDTMARMVVLYFLLLLVTDLCGLVLAAFTLPGLWLMLGGAALYAYLTSGMYLGKWSLISLLILAVSAELAELFFGGAGAKKAGASAWGIVGGLIGAIVGGITLSGLIPIPVLGTIIGICLGTFLGAFSIELILGQPLSRSALIGLGAAKGRLTGIVGKIAFGLAMMLITFIAAFPVHGSKPVTASPMAAPTTQQISRSSIQPTTR